METQVMLCAGRLPYFLLGITGSRHDAVQVMAEVTEYLEHALHLTVSQEKSAVRQSRQGVIFLGYEVRSYPNDKVINITVNGTHTKQRTICEQMDVYVPEAKLEKFCTSKGYGLYHSARSRRRAELRSLSDLEIGSTYKAECRGLAQYYARAHDAKQKLSKLHDIWQGSLWRTLADKHKTRVKMQLQRLRQHGDRAVTYRVGNQERTRHVFNVKYLKGLRKACAQVALMPKTFVYSSGTELQQRYNAQQCEYCGKQQGYFEVHHVKKLSDIQDGKAAWQKLMIARHRKTLVLWVACHDQLHAGKLPSWKRSNREMESAIRCQSSVAFGGGNTFLPTGEAGSYPTAVGPRRTVRPPRGAPARVSSSAPPASMKGCPQEDISVRARKLGDS